MFSSMNIDFVVCSVFVNCFIIYHFLSKKEYASFQNKVFLIMVLLNISSGLVDFFSYRMTVDTLWFLEEIFYLCNVFYIVSHIALPYLLTVYIFSATGRMRTHGKIFFLHYSIPLFVSLVFIVLNFFFDNVFYIQEGKYYNGPFILVFYIVAAIYIAEGFYLILRYRNCFSSANYYSIILFLVLGSVSSVIQFMYPNVRLELFVQSMMSLCILLSVENQNDLINYGTMVYNRDTFVQQNIRMMNSKIPYTVVLLKLSNIRSLMSVIGIDLVFEVMKDIANYLEIIVGSRDLIFDCNHYTFGIILDEKYNGRVKEISNSIYTKFQHDWRYNGMNIPLTIVMGIVNIPMDIRTIDNLMLLIDTTDENLHDKISLIREERLSFLFRRAKIETILLEAIKNNSFEIYYQPIWDCKSKTIHSAEALVRLQDEDLGIIHPEELISVAERTGKIKSVGKCLVEKVCDFKIGKDAEELGIDYITINVSTLQCLQSDLPYLFKETLEKKGLTMDCIHLDIKESATITSASSAEDTIHTLRVMGFRLAIDNYGTGHADSEAIFSMDFSGVKIDRSLLWKSLGSANAKIFFQNTVAMLKKMNLEVSVTGVETEEMRDFVCDSGIDLCQGYYFSSPLPEKEFVEFCRKFSKGNASS